MRAQGGERIGDAEAIAAARAAFWSRWRRESSFRVGESHRQTTTAAHVSPAMEVIQHKPLSEPRGPHRRAAEALRAWAEQCIARELSRCEQYMTLDEWRASRLDRGARAGFAMASTRRTRRVRRTSSEEGDMQRGNELARYAALIELNDARRQQIDAAKQRAARADAMNCDRPTTTANSQLANTSTAHRVLLQCAADVKPQAISWLWPDWLPAGKLTILAGAAGTGKTTLALALAAVVSRGARWPDGGACTNAGNVLIWSSEDDPADTIVPRLMLAGADLSRVYFVRNVASADGELMPFDPARDLPLLNERITQMGGARLLIVDPVISAVSGDAHRANDVRRNLQPLVDLAVAHDCAVIGISHFSKGSQGRMPTERVIGSQAFAALARMVLVTAKEEGTERRILARAKSNIAPDDGGFAYTLEQAEAQPGIVSNRIMWGERIEGTAREILEEVEQVSNDGAQTEQDEAEALLRGLLDDGPMRARELKSDADGAGFNWKTMQRAASRLGVEKRKIGMKEGWEWALPKNAASEEDTKNPSTNTMSPSA